MGNAITALLGSRKFWIGTLSVAATIVVNVLAILGKIPQEQVWPMVTGIVTMGGAVIAGTALEDAGAKVSLPPPAPPVVAAPRPPSSGNGTAAKVLGGACLVALVVWVGSALAGCAWFQSKGPQAARTAGEIVACVLEHEDLPVENIAYTCGLQNADDVLAIISAHRAAVQREVARAGGPR